MESYWTPEDALAGRCRIADVGEDRPGAVVELVRLDTSPEGIVRTAVETLLRACGQTRDLPSAVKAAAALLRYYAPPPQLPQQPELPAPSWLSPELRYKPSADGLPEQRPPMLETPIDPDPAPPPAQPPIAAPARAGDPARPVLKSVPPAPPNFFDRPNQPAVGPYRGA